MAEKRRDNKGRVLRSGESQRSDGKYEYKYADSKLNTPRRWSWTVASLKMNTFVDQIEHWQLPHRMLKWRCFTHMENRATLRSDPSALWGLQVMRRCPDKRHRLFHSWNFFIISCLQNYFIIIRQNLVLHGIITSDWKSASCGFCRALHGTRLPARPRTFYH